MSKWHIGIILGLLVFCLPAIGQAASVTGWGWSDTIGWISFSSTNSGGSPQGVSYGVEIDDVTGEFSGHAWNDAIGWISFNGNEVLSECGSVAPSVQPAQVIPNSGTSGGVYEVVGFAWAKAGGTPESGGWTGCIELSGTNHPSPDISPTGGVTYNDGNGTLTGWAWGAIPSTGGNGGNNLVEIDCGPEPWVGLGSDCTGVHYDGVIGWFNFYDVQVDLNFEEPALTLQADPFVVYPLGSLPPQLGQWGTTTLIWNSNIQLMNCQAMQTGSTNQAGNDWLIGTKSNPPGNQQNVSVPWDPTNYQIACEDQSGNTVESNVEQVFQHMPDGYVSVLSDVSCIPEAGPVTITWDAEYVNPADCRFDSDPSGSLPDGSATGNQTVNISQSGTFIFSCTDLVGNQPSDSVSVEVGGSCGTTTPPPGDGVRPRYEEI